MKKKIVLLLMAVAVFMAVLSGCGGNQTPAAGDESAQPSPDESTPVEPQSGGTLIVGIQGDPTSFNPDAAPDDFAYVVEENIFSRLVKFNYNNEILPDLAQTWDISEDGMTYTFHLVQGIKWHDGTDFSSADVKWTFDQIISQAGYLASSLANVDSIEAPDADTVVFNMTQPDSTLLSSLSFLGAFIIPKHLYEGTDWTTADAAQTPVGTGPFKFVSYDKGVSITLEANTDYFGTAPLVDKLIYKIIPDSNTALQAFNNGELDVLGVFPPYAEVPNLEGNADDTVVKNTTTGRYYVTYNVTKEPWSDLAVRESLALAIDRSEILDKAFMGVGTVAEGFYSPAVAWAYNGEATLPDLDAEAAVQLLETAGYTKDADGYYFSVELATFNMSPFTEMATVVKSNLEAIGIAVDINVLEQAAWMQKCLVDRDFDITIMGGMVGPDPSALYSRIGTNGYINFMGYSNDEIEQLFAEAGTITDQDDRAEKYKQIQQIMADELPIIPLVNDITVNVYKSYLSGLPYDSAIDEAAMNEFTYVSINN